MKAIGNHEIDSIPECIVTLRGELSHRTQKVRRAIYQNPSDLTAF